MTADLVLYVQSLEAHLKDAQLRFAAADRVVEAARGLLAHTSEAEDCCTHDWLDGFGSIAEAEAALAAYEKAYLSKGADIRYTKDSANREGE